MNTLLCLINKKKLHPLTALAFKEILQIIERAHRIIISQYKCDYRLLCFVTLNHCKNSVHQIRLAGIPPVIIAHLSGFKSNLGLMQGWNDMMRHYFKVSLLKCWSLLERSRHSQLPVFARERSSRRSRGWTEGKEGLLSNLHILLTTCSKRNLLRNNIGADSFLLRTIIPLEQLPCSSSSRQSFVLNTHYQY